MLQMHSSGNAGAFLLFPRYVRVWQDRDLTLFNSGGRRRSHGVAVMSELEKAGTNVL